MFKRNSIKVTYGKISLLGILVQVLEKISWSPVDQLQLRIIASLAICTNICKLMLKHSTAL